ncbi:MAG: hypothetical protein AB7O84_16640 [Planctomycetota bacterium]
MEAEETRGRRRVAPVVALLWSMGLSAQTTWTVDRLGRPGTDFLDLQPAVDAAASGDVIRIRAAGAPTFGAPSYNAPIIDGKGLTVLGEGSASTWMRGNFQVRNLQPGQLVRLADFVVWEFQFSPIQSGMRLDGNEGVVVLERVRLDVKFNNPGSGIYDCSLVIMSQVHVVAQPSGMGSTRSTLVLQDCLYESINTNQGLTISPFGAIDSRVWMHHTTILGRDANVVDPASNAVNSAGSEIFLGPGTFLRGGIGQVGRMAALRATLTQDGRYVDVHLDPGVTWLGTLEGDIDDGPVTSLRQSTTASTLTLDHSCTPNALVLLTAGPLLATPWSLAEGLLAIQPVPDFVCTAFAPASGLLQWNFPLPPGLPASFVLGMQGAELRTDGSVRITDVSMVTGR